MTTTKSNRTLNLGSLMVTVHPNGLVTLSLPVIRNGKAVSVVSGETIRQIAEFVGAPETEDEDYDDALDLI
jgi:hypothetical protein